MVNDTLGMQSAKPRMTEILYLPKIISFIQYIKQFKEAEKKLC